MMLSIEVNGRAREVSIERVDPDAADRHTNASSRRFRIVLDGRERIVDAARLEGASYSLILPEEGFASHRVDVQPGPAPGELTLHVGGRVFSAAVNGRSRRRVAWVGATAGAQRVVAPMPGKILRVLVTAGDAVTSGQGLVVVEAMKMENELRSPRAGTVTQLPAVEGALVEANTVLVVVE